MQSIIFLMGVILTTLLIFCFIMYVIYKIVKLEDNPNINLIDMPVLIPVPISTKKYKNGLHKLLVFIFKIRQWELAECWRYKLNEEDELIIPKGFRFDGASIPKIFRIFMSPTGLQLIPGLLHDCGYKFDQVWKINAHGCPEPFRRGAGKEYWDQLFLDVSNNVNGIPLINFIAWLAVAAGGNRSWNKYRRSEMNTAQSRQAA